MRRILLDTNAFAIMATEDVRLSDAMRDVLLQADSLSLCAISFYEIAQKVRLGKWPEMEQVEPQLLPLARSEYFEIIPITPDLARHAALLPWSNRDPFDRMIAASALERGEAIMSSDRAFDSLDIERIWD